MKNFKSQLRSLVTGAIVASIGGVVYAALAGTTKKASLFNPDTGLPIANPLALTNGSFDFNVADTVQALDLYILSPTGHMAVVKNVKPSGDASIMIDTGQAFTTLVIPFHYADGTANTEISTGFIVPGAVQSNPAVDVKAIDAGITIDVGTLSSASGDADGFVDGVSVATLGYVKGTLLNTGVTLGALLKVQDTANAGDAAPEQSTVSIGKQVTYTLSAGADTAQGYILLPVQLPVASL